VKAVRLYMAFFVLVTCIAVGREIYWSNTNLLIPISDVDFLDLMEAEHFSVLIYNNSISESEWRNLKKALVANRKRIYSLDVSSMNEGKNLLGTQVDIGILPSVCSFSFGRCVAQLPLFQCILTNYFSINPRATSRP